MSATSELLVFNMAVVRHLGFVLPVWTIHEEHLVVVVTVQHMVVIGAAVFSERELVQVRYMLSPFRLSSVCRLPVCDVGAPYLAG